ncbi:MAG: hypothetical protein GF398_01140 [Chitinivibrionales bacterium]|nr:hypothetical protein [Chitinivibrionales bacterium]
MFDGLVKVSNAAKYLPERIVWNLAINGFVVSDNCLIYQLKGFRHLRLKQVHYSVPQAYEELLARHGTRFKIFFIIYDGNICTLMMFPRWCPYADTIAHGVINQCARFVND